MVSRVSLKGLYSRVYGAVDGAQFGDGVTGSMQASPSVSRQIGTLRPRDGDNLKGQVLHFSSNYPFVYHIL